MLNFVEQGNAQNQSIVILHGLFGSLKNWNQVSKQLAKDYYVISVDLRNHGDSFKSDEMSYELMADDVYQLIQSLLLNTPIIMGHSMGGKVSMALVEKYPTLFFQLIVVDIAPVNYQHSFNNLVEPILSIDLNTLSSRKDADELLKDSIKEDFVRLFLLQSLAKNESGWYWKNNWKVLSGNNTNITNTPIFNSTIGVKTLFVFGSESEYYTSEGVETIKQNFDNVSIDVIEGGNHWLHYQKADQFMSILKQNLLQK
ncbi:MAG: alpha/beta fold hydrolase [Gammaproteobacteria bacterium]|nr:alpha/beta fold hydrolase [Gammaproteobacteria bacterium]